MQMTSLALQSVSSLRAPANIQWISIFIFLETDARKTVENNLQSVFILQLHTMQERVL